MNRFRKYKLHYYRGDKGARIIAKRIYDPEYGFARASVLEQYLYRVQTHKSFLGISYWKTRVKTTSYKIANDAYDLMMYDGKIGF